MSNYQQILALASTHGLIRPRDLIAIAALCRPDAAGSAGVRVMLLGVIDVTLCQIQIDIGFGDAVTPGPDEVEYPVMLSGFPAPNLLAYPRYTVVAEKFEAQSSLASPTVA